MTGEVFLLGLIDTLLNILGGRTLVKKVGCRRMGHLS